MTGSGSVELSCSADTVVCLCILHGDRAELITRISSEFCPVVHEVVVVGQLAVTGKISAINQYRVSNTYVTICYL